MFKRGNCFTLDFSGRARILIRISFGCHLKCCYDQKINSSFSFAFKTLLTEVVQVLSLDSKKKSICYIDSLNKTSTDWLILGQVPLIKFNCNLTGILFLSCCPRRIYNKSTYVWSLGKEVSFHQDSRENK